MEIVIEQVISSHDKAAAWRIRTAVFESEMGIELARLETPENAYSLDLLARVEPEGEAVAALRVVDTTSDKELHQRCQLAFDSSMRTARYTQLAVLKAYRGMDIPLMLMLEAHRQFVRPGGFDMSWLLFAAQRAHSSFLCRHLDFSPQDSVVEAEYGLCRALIRNERAPGMEQTIQLAEQYLTRSTTSHYPRRIFTQQRQHCYPS